MLEPRVPISSIVINLDGEEPMGREQLGMGDVITKVSTYVLAGSSIDSPYVPADGNRW